MFLQRFKAVVVAIAVWVAAAGGAAAQPRASLAPADWDADLRLADAPDRNPDPRIVEIDLVAQVADVDVARGRPGVENNGHVTAWTYNGLLPGPFIRAKLGDRLVVHFRNELPQPTTVHWHGVRVPIEMDGVPEVSQPEVRTGETFTYDFVLRDAGLYWYHPHVLSAAQVGFGLYGALLVEDPAEDVGVADQVTLVLSDIGYDRHGTLEPADSGGSAGMVFGREGATVLVNGRVRPTLKARAGAPQRWRVVNTAKTRFFYLDLDGQPFVKIGGDGGLQEHPVTSELVLVTPGERVDLIVAPTGKPGGRALLRSSLYNRGYGSVEFRTDEDLLTIEFAPEAALPTPTLPAVTRRITPPSIAGATPVELVFTLPPVDERGHSEFRINGVPYWKATPYLAKLGETQIWTLRNDTVWDHPFHLHGFFFVVLDDKGEAVRPLAWKDTVNVPRKSALRLVVSFDERPGTWMFHCHILDHADGGLMGTVQVGDGPAVPHGHRKVIPER